jgi:hypothetical protein
MEFMMFMVIDAAIIVPIFPVMVELQLIHLLLFINKSKLALVILLQAQNLPGDLLLAKIIIF